MKKETVTALTASTPDFNDYMTPAQVAEQVGVTRAAVYIAMTAGRLPFITWFGRKLICKKDAAKWSEVVGVNNGYRERLALKEGWGKGSKSNE